MIPTHIHQIWIGPKQRPNEWLDTWPKKNPSFTFTLWDEQAIDNFGLVNRDKYDRFMKKQLYDGAADVARVEILLRLGGIYLDADSVCRQTIEGASFLELDFFAVFEYDERIANGVIGTVPYHPILLTYQQRIQSATVIEPPCFTIGGTLLTTCVDRFMWYNRPRHHGAKYSAVKILPSYTFYPKLGHYHEADGLAPPIYARQMWGTTKGIYKDAT
jgi:mannosyltransferase OCH1-like enzyme